jgi:hypothetical protein
MLLLWPGSEAACWADIGEAGRQLPRQVGQEEWEENHVSMHCAWNPCLHLPSTRISSPSMNSDKQMAHSASAPASFTPAENTSVGAAANGSSATSFSRLLFR